MSTDRVNLLFCAQAELWSDYETPLNQAFETAGLAVRLDREMPVEDVDYVIYAPNGPQLDFTKMTRLKAVLSLWAGVESITRNETITVPLCRMVDPSLTEGMVEWVTGHVLRHHLGMDAHILGQDGIWRAGIAPPLARDRRVSILGIGALGAATGQALAALNFNVSGWSRTAKEVGGLSCHSGTEGLRDCLSGAEIVVLLLPSTPDTENTLNTQTIALLAPGAIVINPGRGTLIDDAALLAALDHGQIGHATLDVFRQEPLPREHPFWSHPNVTVTPHIASETRPSSASVVIAENIRRGLAGEPFLNVVDTATGY